MSREYYLDHLGIRDNHEELLSDLERVQGAIFLCPAIDLKDEVSGKEGEGTLNSKI